MSLPAKVFLASSLSPKEGVGGGGLEILSIGTRKIELHFKIMLSSITCKAHIRSGPHAVVLITPLSQSPSFGWYGVY